MSVLLHRAFPDDIQRPEQRPPDTYVQEHGRVDGGILSRVDYITIATPDYRPLTWAEVWATFADAYPDRWAVQFFPPQDHMVNEVNKYHLYILPRSFNPEDCDISKWE